MRARGEAERERKRRRENEKAKEKEANDVPLFSAIVLRHCWLKTLKIEA